MEINEQEGMGVIGGSTAILSSVSTTVVVSATDKSKGEEKTDVEEEVRLFETKMVAGSKTGVASAVVGAASAEG